MSLVLNNYFLFHLVSQKYSQSKALVRTNRIESLNFKLDSGTKDIHILRLLTVIIKTQAIIELTSKFKPLHYVQAINIFDGYALLIFHYPKIMMPEIKKKF